MKTLVTTRYSAVRPLSVKGQRVIDLQQQLSRLIAGRAGDPRAALLFARPRIIERSDSIAWDTTAEGTLQRIVDLPPDRQGEAYQKFEQVVGEISRVVETLKATGNERSLLDAQLLAAALSHAGDSDVFLVDDQPVLVNWGCEAAVKEAASVRPAHVARRPVEEPDPAQKIERVARREILELPRTEPVPPPPKPRAGFHLSARWLWLLAWLIVLLLLIAEPRFAERLVVNPRDELTAARAAQAAALHATDTLDQEIAHARPGCAIAEITQKSFAERAQTNGVKPHPVTVTLLWNGDPNVDLSVVPPSGHPIGVFDGTPPAGEVLYFASQGRKTPNESIAVIAADNKNLPAGHYQVFARLMGMADHPTAEPLPYGVQIAIEGRPPIVHYGYLRSVDKWLTKPVAEFDGGS